jgi:hypothetical protein
VRRETVDGLPVPMSKKWTVPSSRPYAKVRPLGLIAPLTNSLGSKCGPVTELIVFSVLAFQVTMCRSIATIRRSPGSAVAATMPVPPSRARCEGPL